VHNVHHPVAMMDYYDDQKAEAARAAAQFREQRMPKFLRYFEQALAANPGDWLMGDTWSYGDTSLFQIVAGLRYMFPKRIAAIADDYPALTALHDRVAALDGIAAYLASDRRIAFNTDGIFRHYPELDAS
jgi:glutathione S-transferase